MSYVNHKTTTPGGNSDLYGYAFIGLPDPKSPTNPKGVTIDGNILPARDIYDYAHNTNKWKEMHGVDLYFLQEGVAERYYASLQFTGTRGTAAQWPQTWQIWDRWTAGIISSYWWRQMCGRYDEIGEPTHLGGIGRYYKENFLNITSTSQLPSSILTYSDGSDIELYIPTGLGYPHEGQYCYNYLVDMIAPLDQSMMISHIADFNAGNPLAAQNVRKMYKDLEILKYYIPPIDCINVETPSSSQAYKGQIWTSDWYKTSKDYLQWNIIDPDAPSGGYSHKEIINEYSQAFGNPTYAGFYEINESDVGIYRVPCCGKTANGYDPIYGSEVAVYVCLRMEWFKPKNAQWQPDKFGFFKMSNYTIDRNSGYVDLDTGELVRHGYELIDHYNARIPRQIPPTWEDGYGTYIEVQSMYIVCKLTDRTDTTQLNWNLRPQ